MNENIKPYQSCSKSVFLVLGIIFISWISLFSIFLILQGAWPVSIFLGLEYLVIFYLIRLYFKEKNIKDEINIDQKEISIKKYRGNKLLHSSKFSTYWSKVFFTKFKNTSKLLIRESDKETEVATFLHADLKEGLYLRIKKQLNFY
ncbi:DUF2244 domain-containing protein [Pelagibacteraceae bacterium]|nr:DUF2244 domain-containing protein [Pelagibacteraceae bacterium]MDC3178462.1 DUF2244 domain-containing protein [Pelagibacteraceae bacterium]